MMQHLKELRSRTHTCIMHTASYFSLIYSSFIAVHSLIFYFYHLIPFRIKPQYLPLLPSNFVILKYHVVHFCREWRPKIQIEIAKLLIMLQACNFSERNFQGYHHQHRHRHRHRSSATLNLKFSVFLRVLVLHTFQRRHACSAFHKAITQKCCHVLSVVCMGGWCQG